jgi:hypothetical protein
VGVHLHPSPQPTPLYLVLCYIMFEFGSRPLFLSNGHWTWLVDYLRFYVPLKIFFTLLWRAAKFWPLSRERSLSCHIYCDTGLSFSCLFRRTAPIHSPLMTHNGMWRIYCCPDLHGSPLDFEKYHELSDFRSFVVP